MIVVWRVTEKCNLGCGFCAYDRRLAYARREADPQQIRRVGALLAEHQASTGDRVLVSWIGGEPLRWEPLAALSREFSVGHGLGISTTTNGTPLASAVTRDHMLQDYAELTVSVDAIGEAHDRLRGRPGLFDTVRESVRLLDAARRSERRPLKLRANVVLMRETIGQFAELIAELATWGFDEITYNVLGGRDRPEFFAEHRVLPEQMEAFVARLPDWRSRMTARGVTLSGGSAYLERLQSFTEGRAMPVEDCGPGEQFLFIDELGRVAPCSFTVDRYGVSLDELQEAGDLRRLPLTFSLMRREHRAAVCHDCPSTHVFAKFARLPGP